MNDSSESGPKPLAISDLLERTQYYRKRGHRKVRAHYLAAKHNERQNAWLGVPVVVTSTIVGTTIFATLSENPDQRWRIGAGLLSLAAAVLAALQTFFRYSEFAEKHRLAGAGYAATSRALDLFTLRLADRSGDRSEALTQLESFARQLDQLERESPDVPDSFYDQAVAEQRADTEGLLTPSERLTRALPAAGAAGPPLKRRVVGPTR